MSWKRRKFGSPRQRGKPFITDRRVGRVTKGKQRRLKKLRTYTLGNVLIRVRAKNKVEAKKRVLKKVQRMRLERIHSLWEPM